MGTSHLVQVRPRWEHTHQVQVRPRYIESIQVPMMARKRPESTGPGEDHIWIRVIVFQVRPEGDNRTQVQESPIWEPEPRDPGEVQVGPQSQGPGEALVQQDSPSPGEAQVATSHQIQM